MNKKKKDFYTVKDVAELLGVSISKVHTYIKKDQIEAYQILGNGPYRISPDEFRRLERENG